MLNRICLAVSLLLLTTAGASETAWSKYSNGETELAPSLNFPHETCFRSAAIAHDVPLTLLLAVARGESDFNVRARSHANAHGLMQILWPTTANHLGIHRLSQLYEPCVNVDAGARYLREMLNRYDGNVHLALAAYNYGPHRIHKNRKIPDGAAWYSGYIHRHLNYVLGNASITRPVPDTLYSSIGQSTLLTFAEPYRAEAFIERLEKQSSELSLDWFRRGTGEFEVVMTYQDREEFEQSARRLAQAGFRID